MALSILDGNQSATTLSTILSSGQHITAHTVVSLGTQAITDIVNATSANLTNTQLRASAVTVGGTVTVGNSLTISSLPAISGTVTANPTGTQTIAGAVTANGGDFTGIVDLYAPQRAINIGFYDGQYTGNFVHVNNDDIANYFPVNVGSMPAISGTVTIGSALPAGTNRIGVVTIGAGTVTIGAGTAQIGSVTASISGTVPISISSVTVGNGVTIGSLPAISGTVTANTFAVQGTAVTTSNFTSTTASTVLANYNATRQVLTIFNEGAGNLHICAGATCTTIAYQVRLSAGDYYEVPNHQTTITHSAVFATAGTARVCQVS